jgi:ketosteroid isomerase-like protein
VKSTGADYSRERVRLLALAMLVVVAAGCGGGDPSAESVVRAWSEALNTGDDEAAADLFAPGAEIVQGDARGTLRTHADAVLFNRSLPCSGRIVRVEDEGDGVTATFLLGDRPRSACDAPGAEVRAFFRVEEGKITLWHQLPGASADPGPAA